MKSSFKTSTGKMPITWKLLVMFNVEIPHWLKMWPIITTLMGVGYQNLTISLRLDDWVVRILSVFDTIRNSYFISLSLAYYAGTGWSTYYLGLDFDRETSYSSQWKKYVFCCSCDARNIWQSWYLAISSFKLW